MSFKQVTPEEDVYKRQSGGRVEAPREGKDGNKKASLL